MRNKWKRGHPPPWSFPPSFPSPLSDLLFSLSLETGFLHTCIFSCRAPNRCIFFHILASGRGHADFLIVLLERKKQGRDSLARPSQVLSPGPISGQWVCLWKDRDHEGAGFLQPVLGTALLRAVGVSMRMAYICANWIRVLGAR